MSRIPRLFSVRRDRSSIERAVDDELRFHFDMTIRELIAGGHSPEDARREAERRFGDVDAHRRRLTALDRERERARRVAEWWNGFAQDLRYTLRGLRHQPGFALAVVLTLGLGIGANATMFGIVDRLLFRTPTALVAPDRVHRLYFVRTSAGKEFAQDQTQYQRFLDVTAAARSLDATAAYAPRQLAVGQGDDVRDVTVGATSASMWSFFDIKPVIGRFFTADEDHAPNGTKVAVLSYEFWHSRFDARTSVIGEPIHIGRSVYTIIGVAPRGFSAMALETPVAFVPLTAAGDDAYTNAWATCRAKYCLTWVEMYVRRKPGLTAEQANADLDLAFRQSYLTQVAVSPGTTPIGIAKPHVVVAAPIAERGPNQHADTKVAAWLLGVAGVVLLIACANVGNLMLGRAFRRRREIAVRIALGVSRGRLLRQLLVEGLLLAALGGVAGLAIAQWGGRILSVMLLPNVEWTTAIADPRVALFSAIAAVGAGILCSVAPAIYARRTDVSSALKAGAREGRSHRSRTRAALLVVQAALSVVLLIGAGLFLQSVRNVGNVHLGYDADRLLWVELNLRGTKLDSAATARLRDRVLDQARRSPDVEQAAMAVSVPFWIEWNTGLFVSGIDSVDKLGDFDQQEVTPGFFATMGTRILRGRGITEQDRAGAPLSIVVSEAMAKTVWPNEDALGKCIRVGDDTMPCTTVVGVAENIKQHTLGDDPGLTYYLSFVQQERGLGGLYVRVHGNARDAQERVRRSLQSVMPGSGYVSTMPMSNVIDRRMRSWRLGSTMFTVFGGLALVLAAIGLYSVIAHGVAERTHEMGVRMALGARVADVARLVMSDGLRVVVIGVASGCFVALLAGHWIAPLLFRIASTDPVVFVGVIVALLLVGAAACAIPALRATRVDPSEALRAD